MQRRAVRVQRPAGHDDFAAVGHAVAVGVVEAQEIGGRSDVEASAIPQRPHGHADLVGENFAAIENAVAVGVLKQPDSHFRLGLHLVIGQILSGGLADKQPAPVVVGDEHGIGHQVRAGHHLHLKTLGDMDGIESSGGGLEILQELAQEAGPLPVGLRLTCSRVGLPGPGRVEQGATRQQRERAQGERFSYIRHVACQEYIDETASARQCSVGQAGRRVKISRLGRVALNRRRSNICGWSDPCRPSGQIAGVGGGLKSLDDRSWSDSRRRRS